MIFSYGTLLLEEVQLALTGRILSSREAVLKDFSINIGETYYNILPNPGGFVEGRILEVTQDEVFRIDQWEAVPLYVKEIVEVETKDGKERGFVYRKSGTEEKIELVNKIEKKTRNEDLSASLAEFLRNRKNGEGFPICDLYLQYPIFSEKKEQDYVVGSDDLNDKEKQGHLLGIYELNMMEAGKNLDVTSGFYFSSENIKTSSENENTGDLRENKGYLTLALPVCLLNPLLLYRRASDFELYVGDRRLEQFLYETFQLKIGGKPTCSIFSSENWKENDLQALSRVGDPEKVTFKVSGEFPLRYEERAKWKCLG